jgi:multisubunit Na+/H+ antiporter MnhG subunit
MVKATLAAAIGLLVGVALVWWVRPDASAGAIFIVVAATLVGSVVGALLAFIRSQRAARDGGGTP